MLVLKRKSNVSNQKGLSLIELSIVLVISGLILVPLLFAAQIYMENYRREKLARLEKVVQYVMKTYAERYFRYPCPALRPTSTNLTAFGDGGESRTGSGSDYVCSAPTVDGARNAWSSGSASNNVMYGVLPEYTWEKVKQADGSIVDARIYLKDLIPTDEPIVNDFLDPWGGRLTYLVTKGLTNTSTFNPLNGTVSVVDENNYPTDGIDKNGHYALISHGSDMGGAVNRNGIISKPCPSSSVSELEYPNCNIASQASNPIVSGLIRKTDNSRAISIDGTAHIFT
jgi:prepilin-type N-terminal cleavage/methylation domain-containing protein